MASAIRVYVRQIHWRSRGQQGSLTRHEVIGQVHSEFCSEISSPILLLHSQEEIIRQDVNVPDAGWHKKTSKLSLLFVSADVPSPCTYPTISNNLGVNETYQSRCSPLFEVLVLGDHQVAIALNSHRLSSSLSPSTTKSTPSSDVELGLITSHSHRQPRTSQRHGFKVSSRSPQSYLWVFRPSSFPGLSSSRIRLRPARPKS